MTNKIVRTILSLATVLFFVYPYLTNAGEEAGNWPVGHIFEDITKASQIDTDMANSDINDPQCVKQSEAIEAWESAINALRPNNPNFTTSECDPCKCPSDSWMIDCWKFMESQAQAEKDEHNRQVELLERARAHGICKEEP